MLIVSRALTGIKLRLKGAQRGHSLLKKKSDALTMRFRAVLKQIIKVRAMAAYSQYRTRRLLARFSRRLTSSILSPNSLLETALGPTWSCSAHCHRYVIIQNVDKANLKIRSAKENVAGWIFILSMLIGQVCSCLCSSRMRKEAQVCGRCASHMPGFELAGLSKGGQKIRQCAEAWTKAVKLLVELASLQVRPVPLWCVVLRGVPCRCAA